MFAEKLFAKLQLLYTRKSIYESFSIHRILRKLKLNFVVQRTRLSTTRQRFCKLQDPALRNSVDVLREHRATTLWAYQESYPSGSCHSLRGIRARRARVKSCVRLDGYANTSSRVPRVRVPRGTLTCLTSHSSSFERKARTGAARMC